MSFFEIFSHDVFNEAISSQRSYAILSIFPMKVFKGKYLKAYLLFFITHQYFSSSLKVFLI